MSGTPQIRNDRSTLAPPVERLTSGEFEGIAARVHLPGDGLPYPGGHVEYRDLAELRKIVDQLPGKPVTLNHPAGLVDGNTKVVGKVVSARLDEGNAIVRVRIDDLKALERIKNGTQALSLGYQVMLDDSNYQRSTLVDHLAIVDVARCGETCKLNLNRGDCCDTCRKNMQTDADLNAAARHALGAEDFAVPEREGLPINDAAHLRAAMARFGQFTFQDKAEKKAAYNRIVKKAKALGVDSTGFEREWTNRLDDAKPSINMGDSINTEDALRSLEAQRLDALQSAEASRLIADSEKLRADKLEGKVIELEKLVTELQAQIASGAVAAETAAITREAQRADAAEDKISKFNANFEQRVNERVVLVTKAGVVLGPETKLDGLPDREIMAAVVKKLDPNADVSNAVSDGVIHGRFLAATERHAATARSLARVAEATAAKTRADASSERKPLWMEPLPSTKLKNL